MIRRRSNPSKDMIIGNINDDIRIIDKEDIMAMFNNQKDGTRAKFRIFR
ncbi:hypothetical protein [Clostridium aciditolerans]|uniref:Uncharacterized protein n=1 Tax=Clostridium aciditolerans TaxID=339861 RepID=A0A934HUC6_9CLOT|nr:hypothetical protein [Clostridium aciditolerans]MBI6874716.1 hypothetical protein [Clostridium aciditolerans]